MNTEKLKNETEILGAEDEKLRAMCRSLKAVDAPKDFDFKLKARIAGSKASDFQPRFGFTFRYALPALALILVLGLLALNGGFWSPENTPVIAEGSTAQPNSALPQNAAVSSFSPPEVKEQPTNSSPILPSNQDLPKIPEKELADRKPGKSESEKRRELKHDNFNGSAVKTWRKAEVRFPKGFEQKTVPQNLPNDEKSNPIPVSDVLSIMGIGAVLENGKWTVKTVTANSVAENAGVKQNDIVEAIDEQPLSDQTSFSRTVSGKAISVLRGGEKIVIKLKNK